MAYIEVIAQVLAGVLDFRELVVGQGRIGLAL